MPTIFTRIINGEIPGRFVCQDDICVAFLDVRPLARGHVLVVPRDEVDHWVDLSPDVASHLMVVAQRVGRAQRELLSPARIGMLIAGFEVPHVHVHVVPMDSMAALDFSNANPNPDQGDLDRLQIDLAGLLA
ncbi:MAG: HIT family protein [Acidimicrobiaceae bacterium]|nr:HIT family protein [Acidimicrobiaceae bacterium]MBT5579754.1 HIT family protein [Acidimicrobiaceae bacterium]